MLDRALAFHEKNGHRTHFTDVQYSELVQDTMSVIDRIYAERNEPASAELKEVFKEANNQNPQGKYGRHVYSLADFRIDKAYIDKHTLDYQNFQNQLINKKE